MRALGWFAYVLAWIVVVVFNVIGSLVGVYLAVKILQWVGVL